jgi:hypothetical protein
MPDGFYTATGVALNTVVGMTGNNVNAGTHTIAGNADMTAAGAIVYHNGDLVIPSGATINISANVQLRVKGFITLNGVINGKGGGLAGVADPGGALTAPVLGNSGFIGNSRGWDGVDVKTVIPRLFYEDVATVPAALTKGKYEAWPEINLTVLGSTLQGIPPDLRGTGGGPGGRAIRTYDGSTFNAGAGAAGGAGLAIVCRGISFGVSSSINLDGNDPAATVKVVAAFADLYPGCGGGGGPGACLIVLDGNTLSFPNAAGHFSGKCGTLSKQGVPLPARSFKIQGAIEFLKYFPGGVGAGAWAGYQDEQIIDGLDLSVAALRVKFLPFTQTPAPDQQRLPAPLLAITVTPGAGFNTVALQLPELGTFDVVDIYAAITNNRAGATLAYRGRSANFDHVLPVLATRFYWAQTTRISETGLELHSDFLPAGATSGVQATTLNPGGWTPVTTAAGGATMIATSSTIEKSGGSSAWDSQAYSTEKYSACSVSWRANDATHDFIIGLNTDPATDANYTSIDFCINPSSGGTAIIYESGVSIVNIGAYTASTQFLITYDGESIRYYKDAILQRTVLSPGLTLALDSSFFAPGSKAMDVKFQPMSSVTPASMFIVGGNCVYAGTSIRKIGGATAWDSECRSGDGYTEGAFCSARAAQTTGDAMFGLNSDPTTDQSFASIDYAWRIATPAQAMIYESGSLILDLGVSSYTTSTVLAIRHVGALVQYIKDGVIVRSVARAATTPLFFDSSFNVPGTMLLDVQYGPAGRGAEADPSAVYLETFEQPWETSFHDNGNAANVVLSYPNSGQFGGRVISAQRQLFIDSNERIPVDTNALYRITTRIRRTVAGGAGSEQAFCGTFHYNAAGALIANQWNCVSAFDMGAIAVGTWRDFVGWIRGTGTNFGVAPNNDSPTNFDAGTTNFSPALVLNYSAGSGTMECDFIKVERLTSPDDSDNTDKNRIVPDAEFERATDATYWYPRTAGSSLSTTAPVITATGGAVSGKCVLTASGSGVRVTAIYSRRREPYQLGNGQLFTIKLRWRRTSNHTGFTSLISASAVRHAIDPSTATFDHTTAKVAAGGIALDSDTIDARTINVWQEDSGVIYVPRDSAAGGGAYPYISASVVYASNAGLSLEIDYVQVEPGVAADPFTRTLTSGTAFAFSNLYQNWIYDSGSAGNFDLPTVSDDSMKGAKIFFEQAGAGLLTIRPTGGNVLQSAPNTTGNRALSGRYARAYAECIDSNTWRLVGNL